MAEYIERGTAIAKLHALEVIEPLSTMTDARQLLADMPVADATPVVHGRWLDGRCTVCGWEEPDEIGYDGYELSSWEHTNYCPGCGAKMDKE